MKVTNELNELKAIFQERAALKYALSRAIKAYMFWCNANDDDVKAQIEFAHAVLGYVARLEKVVRMQARLIPMSFV